MQTKTLLALLCTIVVLLIGVNDGAPTTPKTVTTKTEKPAVTVVTPKLAGSRTAWQPKVDPKSKKLFNTYIKIISKKLQEVHKVKSTFKPKPKKVSKQIVSGVLHHYLVELPTKKYAYVTIHHQGWKKSQPLKDEHVTVRPQLYELTDKNI